MISEMTVQVRVLDFVKGKEWYTVFLQLEPDFVPHEGFAEWEVLPGCWLQVAEGEPAVGAGPIRFSVENMEAERARMMEELQVSYFDIHGREEVPVRWATFEDPWGNRVGIFEDIKGISQVRRTQTQTQTHTKV
jgi:hypothetical protein